MQGTQIRSGLKFSGTSHLPASALTRPTLDPTCAQNMVEWMGSVFGPHRARLWNEIVASKPRSRAEEAAIAQAVFYVVRPEMDRQTIAALRRRAQVTLASHLASHLTSHL